MFLNTGHGLYTSLPHTRSMIIQKKECGQKVREVVNGMFTPIVLRQQ